MRYLILLIVLMFVKNVHQSQVLLFENFPTKKQMQISELLRVSTNNYVNTQLLGISNIEENFKFIFDTLDRSTYLKLFEFDVVSGWDESEFWAAYFTSKKEFIDTKIDTSKNVLVATISRCIVSTYFESYLVLLSTKSKDPSNNIESKVLYLINAKGVFVQSIASVASNGSVDGNTYNKFNLRKGMFKFKLYSETPYSDNHQDSPMSEYRLRISQYRFFRTIKVNKRTGKIRKVFL